MNFHNNFQKAKKRLKWAANDALCAVGLKKLLINNKPSGNKPFGNKPFSRILVYHGITAGNPLRFNSRFMGLADFERQLRYYKQHYNIVRLSDFVSNSRETNSQDETKPYDVSNRYETKPYDETKPRVCLTFDDGYYNNLKYALPLLEKYKIPAHFFITGITDGGYDILWPDLVDIAGKFIKTPVTINGEAFTADSKGNLISSKSLKDTCKTREFSYIKAVIAALEKHSAFKSDTNLLDYWQQMTADDIRELAKSDYTEIGSHGYYHTSLDKIQYSDACREIKKSKEFLENCLQKEVDSFAYPNGDYNTELVNYSESIGFKYQLASDFLHENDQRIKERFTMNPHISFNNQIISIQKGSY